MSTESIPSGNVGNGLPITDKQTLTVPTIDLSSSNSNDDDDKILLADSVSKACCTIGFFQVINHGIPASLIAKYREQCRLFFALPYEQKLKLKRNEQNARGYFDDELTKQRRDWKEAYDFGVPGTRSWAQQEDATQCLDGCNQFPPEEMLPDFRNVVTEYFDACAKLSHQLTELMVRGLHGQDHNTNDESIIHDLQNHHSSYLRMNYYPPCQNATTDGGSPLGISPHYDAGFLTVLLQDDDCHSLQVQPAEGDGWINVHPIPGALTINTGDMAQVWSNGRYKAPLHRVLTNDASVRYSAPFFYNPSYKCLVRPSNYKEAKYQPVSWGYFRALRFAGDLTDLGVEIQISHFETKNRNGNDNGHVRKQEIFLEQVDFEEPFSVEKYRELLSS